jgi:hypothetical protein
MGDKTFLAQRRRESSILMWWNFVARTPEEIAQARSDWQTHQRFGDALPQKSGAKLGHGQYP